LVPLGAEAHRDQADTISGLYGEPHTAMFK
jgi:hypothetical protein